MEDQRPVASKLKALRLPVLGVIIASTLVSTTASMVGGLIMYFESLASLEDTAKETSESELQAITNAILAEVNEAPRAVERLQAFYYNPKRWTGDYNWTSWGDLSHDMLFSLMKGDKDMYGAGVTVVPRSLANRSILLNTMWKEPMKDGSDFWVSEVYDPTHPVEHFEADTTKDPPEVTTLIATSRRMDGSTAEVFEKLFSFNANYKVQSHIGAFDPRQGGLPEGPNWVSGGPAGAVASRWRDPQVWALELLVEYHAFDAMLVPPPPPHPWSSFRAVHLNVAFKLSAWTDVMDTYRQGSGDVQVLVVDTRNHRIVATTAFVVPFTDECVQATFQSNGHPCPRTISNMSLVLQDAYWKTLAEPSGMFKTLSLDGTEHFVRKADLFQSMIVIWLKPTSAIESKVQSALNLLIIFTVLVLVFDILIGVLDVSLIALPLNKMVHVIERVGSLQTAEATRLLNEFSSRCVMVDEVTVLVEGMQLTVAQLDEYKAYMPAAQLIGDDDDTETSTAPSEAASSVRSSRKSGSRSVVSSASSHSKNALSVHLSQSRPLAMAVVNVVDWSQTRAGQDAVHTYGKLLTVVSAATSAEGGVIDSFSGDRFLLGFNTARPKPRSYADAGARAVLRLRVLLPDLTITSALAAGTGRVGNLGSATMRRFTVLSDVVAWVVLLEQFCKQAPGTRLVADELTAKKLTSFKVAVINGILRPKKKEVSAVAEVRGVIETEAKEWMYELDSAAAMNISSPVNQYALLVVKSRWEKIELPPPEGLPENLVKAARKKVFVPLVSGFQPHENDEEATSK